MSEPAEDVGAKTQSEYNTPETVNGYSYSYIPFFRPSFLLYYSSSSVKRTSEPSVADRGTTVVVQVKSGENSPGETVGYPSNFLPSFRRYFPLYFSCFSNTDQGPETLMSEPVESVRVESMSGKNVSEEVNDYYPSHTPCFRSYSTYFRVEGETQSHVSYHRVRVDVETSPAGDDDCHSFSIPSFLLYFPPYLSCFHKTE